MTTLGLLSDSHGRASTTQLGVELLMDAGADILIHLGDVGTVEVIDALLAIHPVTGQPVEAHVVFGNTDWDARALGEYATELGIKVHDPIGQIDVDGCRVAFTHGHLESIISQAITSQPGFFLHGHTHRISDTVQGQTRVINPGALFRASKYTVATLTPATGTLDVLELSGVTW